MKKMIKKTLITGLLGLMSTGASAAFPDLGGGPNTVTMLQCTQLANDIKIVLTGGVVGSIDCTTDQQIIGLSVCHTSGLTTQRSVAEAPLDATNQTCAPGLTFNATTSKCEGTITGVKFPSATTAQGTVASRYPNQSTCDAGTAVT
jgi:hypothetical protein